MRHARNERGFSIVEVMVVVLLVGILAAMAVPMSTNAVSGYRLRNESRAIATLVGLAKLRATANFTRARVYGDLATHRYRLELWNKTANQWAPEGGTTQMPTTVRFGFGTLGTPPPNTQGAIGQSDACRDNGGAAIANTACILFNSRGIPIDSLGAPQGGNAFYVTDGVGVRATTVTATPLIREWWSPALSAQWIRQ
jgi:prepilin-type N-terminal cleavage/methylation domain-containing protein